MSISTGDKETDDSASSSRPKTSKESSKKCVKCTKRVAREGCTQTACLQCCEDQNCESHKKPRAHALWKEQVLAGTTHVQKLAAAKRNLRMGKRFFREPGFCYTGDTVVIWDIRAYYRIPKLREDAIRKSLRRRNLSTSSETQASRPLRNSRKRFHRLVEERHLATQAEKLKASSS